MSLYTANRVLILIFIRSVALNSKTRSQREIVKNMEDDLMTDKLNWVKILRKLRGVWSDEELKEFHTNAVHSLKKISTKLTIEVDESLPVETKPTCVICMSNEASSYIVHDGTAHGGFCPSCALETMLCKNRACPICRKKIHGIVLKAEQGNCRCGEIDCRKAIYATSFQIHDNRTRVVEKYQCEELDKTELKQKVCDVF
jgi:hypothetical protein